ncbi:hypothetical protein MMPV_009895 [Pyropia vietnamensis]
MGDGGCPHLGRSIDASSSPSPTSVATVAANSDGSADGDSSGDTHFRDSPPAGSTLVGLTAYTRGPRLVGIRGLYAAPTSTATAAAAAAEVTEAAVSEESEEGFAVRTAAAVPITRGRLHGHGGRAHRLVVPPGDLSMRVWHDADGVCGVRVRGVERGAPLWGTGGSVGLRGGDASELLPERGRVTCLWGRIDADGRLADLFADASPAGEGWGDTVGAAIAATPAGDEEDDSGAPPAAAGARLVLVATGSGSGVGDVSTAATGGNPPPPCPFCGWVAGGATPPPDLPPSAHETAADGDRAVHVLRCMDARIAARAAAGVGALLPAGESASAAAGAADGGDDDGVEAAADAADTAAARLAATPFPPGDVTELRAALADARAEIRRLRAALSPAAAAADDRRRCVVCRDADTAVVLLGCGHAVLCGACAAGVVGGGGGCPLCGGHIERVARVFFET